jgi:hypothetical protein
MWCHPERTVVTLSAPRSGAVEGRRAKGEGRARHQLIIFVNHEAPHGRLGARHATNCTSSAVMPARPTPQATAAASSRSVAKAYEFLRLMMDKYAPNKPSKPEEVNSWSYLAFQNLAWSASPTWDVKNLAVNHDGFSGVSFCSGDRSGVWFEGTAATSCTPGARPKRRRPGTSWPLAGSIRSCYSESLCACKKSRSKKS